MGAALATAAAARSATLEKLTYLGFAAYRLSDGE